MDKKNKQQIKKEVYNSPNFTLYDAPKDLLKIIAKQDLVICAAGRTLYECAYLGRPAIIIPSIQHEVATAETYSKLTKNCNIGLWNDESGEKILNQIEHYKSYKIRQKIHNISSNLVDAGAKEKIVKIIIGS